MGESDNLVDMVQGLQYTVKEILTPQATTEAIERCRGDIEIIMSMVAEQYSTLNVGILMKLDIAGLYKEMLETLEVMGNSVTDDNTKELQCNAFYEKFEIFTALVVSCILDTETTAGKDMAAEPIFYEFNRNMEFNKVLRLLEQMYKSYVQSRQDFKNKFCDPLHPLELDEEEKQKAALEFASSLCLNEKFMPFIKKIELDKLDGNSADADFSRTIITALGLASKDMVNDKTTSIGIQNEIKDFSDKKHSKGVKTVKKSHKQRKDQ